MEQILQGDYGTLPTNIPKTLLSLLLAFLTGHIIAWTYTHTHTGLSYSRSFANSLITLPVIVALVMMVLSNNLITAFGLMAIFAIVRFRNILRDTLDTTYILAVIVIGMAAGTMKYTTAALGTLLTTAIMLYLHYTAFGTRHRYDHILNLQWTRPLNQLNELDQLLKHYTLKQNRATPQPLQNQPGANLSYHILMRNPDTLNNLITELQQLNGVTNLTTLKTQPETET